MTFTKLGKAFYYVFFMWDVKAKIALNKNQTIQEDFI